MGISVETFFLNPDAQGTLQAQIQQMIAQGILSGRFHIGEKLPSSRRLAAHLGVSRITVTLAYTELLANDYLTSRGRSGYYVSDNAPVPPAYAPPPARLPDTVDWPRAIARSFTGGDTLDKPRDILRRRVLQNPMPEIENEFSSLHGLQYFIHPFIKLRSAGNQQKRIQISLHDLARLIGKVRHR